MPDRCTGESRVACSVDNQGLGAPSSSPLILRKTDPRKLEGSADQREGLRGAEVGNRKAVPGSPRTRKGGANIGGEYCEAREKSSVGGGNFESANLKLAVPHAEESTSLREMYGEEEVLDYPHGRRPAARPPGRLRPAVQAPQEEEEASVRERRER
ncbi:hypothetical protein THAOC_04436 [Thalassiosira oceanica]|uniref:Uncharacterized protein n=1 Tax=Thalassiosira oceanica TaxID=159749 RepID=K0T570_THAOC|nr:hypothetical protein THAOC_04436 [Thalassiosira oceanica]|eukprot:EJK73918.1 hypothetical protein THAOC_04436 [Thalassiosira oceanica]